MWKVIAVGTAIWAMGCGGDGADTGSSTELVCGGPGAFRIDEGSEAVDVTLPFQVFACHVANEETGSEACWDVTRDYAASDGVVYVDNIDPKTGWIVVTTY